LRPARLPCVVDACRGSELPSVEGVDEIEPRPRNADSVVRFLVRECVLDETKALVEREARRADMFAQSVSLRSGRRQRERERRVATHRDHPVRTMSVAATITAAVA
jgi:hypothetical protein